MKIEKTVNSSGSIVVTAIDLPKLPEDTRISCNSSASWGKFPQIVNDNIIVEIGTETIRLTLPDSTEGCKTIAEKLIDIIDKIWNFRNNFVEKHTESIEVDSKENIAIQLNKENKLFYRNSLGQIVKLD